MKSNVQEHSEKSLALVEMLPEPILILLEDGEVQFANSSAADLMGASQEELVGLPFGLPTSGTAPTEIEVRAPGGRSVAVEMKASSILWDGKPAFLVALHDVSAHKEVQKDLEEAHDRYDLVTRGLHDGLWDWDLRSEAVYYSPRWAQLLGYHEFELGKSLDEWLQRVHPEDFERLKADLYSHLEGLSRVLHVEHRVLQKDGNYEWFLATGSSLRDERGKAIRLAGSLTNIHKRKQYEESIVFVASHDRLTNLPNRDHSIQRLEEVMAKSERRSDHLYAVLFLDIDGFKQVNDMLGHDVGDRLLTDVGRRLKRCIRTGDLAGRLGGDEFILILDELTDSSDTMRVAERVREDVEQASLELELNVRISTSIGIALGQGSYETPDELLRHADHAMYQAKRDGGARAVIYDSNAHHSACETLSLERDLALALVRDELHVVYQPIVDVPSERCVAFEALVRWNHPTRGALMPGEFLPITRDMQLQRRMDAWVIERACEELSGWREEGRSLPLLHVNLSSASWMDLHLAKRLSAITKRTDFDPSGLRLEIDEDVLLPPSWTLEQLKRIREAGFLVHLDDCGRDSIPIQILADPAIEALKIDRCHVQGASASATAKAITALATTLDLKVIAEGVEEKSQLQSVSELGCHQIQGFYFSKPRSPGEARRYWRDRRCNGRLVKGPPHVESGSRAAL